MKKELTHKMLAGSTRCLQSPQAEYFEIKTMELNLFYDNDKAAICFIKNVSSKKQEKVGSF